MITIVIPSSEDYDEEHQIFIDRPEVKLSLEHSLVSLSKWESKWHKAYLHSEKTNEEVIDYIRCMTITQNVNPEVYSRIPVPVLKQIISYIDDPMTATTFRDNPHAKKNRQIITSEVIYAMMFNFNISKECEKWHLNRLFALLRVCGEMQAPAKKMSKKDILKQNRALNEARRAKMKSKG